MHNRDFWPKKPSFPRSGLVVCDHLALRSRFLPKFGMSRPLVLDELHQLSSFYPGQDHAVEEFTQFPLAEVDRRTHVS